ncbi:WD40 repeat-like protein [Auricularia subglabra TFB-10046 SS5]|nr:WD40 repeat-like protein [Auricularia subglabra TFB-10046 SS5]
MSSATFDTTWPADTVEFLPGHDDLLVVGTYLLREATDTTPMSRVGELILMGIDDQLKVLQRIELGAVLDIKWRDRIAAAATADGTIAFFEHTDRMLARLSDVSTASEGVLCLAVGWSTEGRLATSQSDGSLCIVDAQAFSASDSWHACDFEAWTVSWDTFNPHVLFSGGDDCMWKMWDSRDYQSPTFKSNRRDAGITTFAPSPHTEHLLAVGSYDSTLQLYDIRSPRTALSTAGVGGGVWRAKWHPSAARKDDILVACMHDGFKLVRLPGGDVVQGFDEHLSFAYGADWARGPGNDTDKTRVASCSFYDHTLKIWEA